MLYLTLQITQDILTVLNWRQDKTDYLVPLLTNTLFWKAHFRWYKAILRLFELLCSVCPRNTIIVFSLLKGIYEILPLNNSSTCAQRVYHILPESKSIYLVVFRSVFIKRLKANLSSSGFSKTTFPQNPLHVKLQLVGMTNSKWHTRNRLKKNVREFEKLETANGLHCFSTLLKN